MYSTWTCEDSFKLKKWPLRFNKIEEKKQPLDRISSGVGCSQHECVSKKQQNSEQHSQHCGDPVPPYVLEAKRDPA